MTKRQVLILFILAVFIGGGVIFGIFTRQEKINPNNSFNNGPPSLSDSPPKVYYTPEVPQNAVITPPVLEESATINNNSEEKFRSFNLNINQNGYNPQTIVVNKDDIIEIRIEAVGGDYDFNLPALGIYKLIKGGEKNKVSFGVRTSGTFIFECKNYCPLNKKISGSLIVLP